MIELSPPPAHPLRRRSPIPSLFLRITEQEFESDDLELPGCKVQLCVDNSLDMTSYMHRVGTRGQIILDWALVERALMFFSFFWKHVGTEAGYEHLRAYCEREMLLIISRKAAAAGLVPEACHFHRLYRALPSPLTLSHSNNLHRQPRAAAACARYIVTHELAHHICRDLPRLPEQHFEKIRESSPPWSLEYEEDRAEELFCDYFALNCVWGHERRPFRQPPLGAVVLLTIYVALVGIAGVGIALAESPSLGEDTALFRLRDRRFRSHQLRSRLMAMADSHPDPAVGADCQEWARIHELLIDTVHDGAKDAAQHPDLSLADELVALIYGPKGTSETQTRRLRLAELLNFEEDDERG